MSKVLPSSIEIPLEAEVLEEIISKAKDFALSHGISMRPKATYNPDSLSVSYIGSRVFQPKKNFLENISKFWANIAKEKNFWQQTKCWFTL